MPQNPLARCRENASSPVFTVYAIVVAFITYFCMHAFRKRFTAGTFSGQDFLNAGVSLKTAMVIGQLVGYTASKYMGVKFISEASRAGRARALVLLIFTAQAILVLFGIVPLFLRAVVMLANGLPLGMVWGLVVWYIQGRRVVKCCSRR